MTDWGEYFFLSSNMAVVKDCFVLSVLLPICISKPVNISRTLTTDDAHEKKLKETLLEDHIKGLKLERDGHVNKDYHHEAFLGKLVEEGTLLFDNMEGYRRLIDLFHKVDKDEDHKVSKVELTAWIHEKIKEHILEAQANNHKMFKVVDRDGDGYVTWDEFKQKMKEDNSTKKKRVETELGWCRRNYAFPNSRLLIVCVNEWIDFFWMHTQLTGRTIAHYRNYLCKFRHVRPRLICTR